MKEDISSLFRETTEAFTIYVVEQRFAVGRGLEYFRSYKGKANYLDTEKSADIFLQKITKWVSKHIPQVADLIKPLFNLNSPSSIVEMVSALSKLFGTLEHQAVGPEVIDPIILQEGKILQKTLASIITLHKDSIVQPAIIILLKDNNFERAKELLCKCPHGMNVKMIRNSGEAELYKVINLGEDNIPDFLDAYARQCFSTCSNTKRDILLNEEWAENSLIRMYGPGLLKIRSSLLLDHKDKVREHLNDVISAVSYQADIAEVNKLQLGLECIARIFRIYCNDAGGEDIQLASNIADELEIDLLKAHVLRYAHFLPNFTIYDKAEALNVAEHIFSTNNVEDHAIYCSNNRLTYDFYTNSIDVAQFDEMQSRAINNTPGLIGLSIICNNAGVAHLYTGNTERALHCFQEGKQYCRYRLIQKMALECNSIIARSYEYETIHENELRKNLDFIFNTCGTDTLPFMTANFSMNLIAVALRQNKKKGISLIREYPLETILRKALQPNQLGTGSLVKQIVSLEGLYPNALPVLPIPSQRSSIAGIRERYIHRFGYNPTIFNAWL